MQKSSNNIAKLKRIENKGITLIALVITIIILLILTGITIGLVTGDNGILAQATRAKKETEKATEKEKVILNDYEDKINEYIELDWNTILANAQKHPEQKESDVIGVGTDGKAVNMDLWKYTLLDDNTYGLNSEDVFNNQEYGGNNEIAIYNNGYIGNYKNNRISGTIPTYISSDNGTTWKKVSSLYCTFMNSKELKIAPDIPNTVTNMMNTFYGCTSLYDVGSIPNSVVNLAGTFYGCTNLENSPIIGNKVEDMSNTFLNTSIKICPQLPETVNNMQYTFANSKLESINTIPNNVINMKATFKNCGNLKHVGNIPVNVIYLQEAFNGCINLETVDFNIGPQVKNLMATFQMCEKINGKINIDAGIKSDDYDSYKWIFSGNAGILGTGLEVTGTSEILDDIKDIYSSNPNITINKSQ